MDVAKAPGIGETSMKFGPHWIRALSHGNAVSQNEIPPPPKYKLAQYRYGREEMLSLFTKSVEMPDSLKEFDYLTQEKCQTPLALLPISEEEQRIWSRPINSDAALRVSNKGPTGPGNGMSRGGGRGGSVDRGGRGRGRGGYHSRGFSFEDGEDGSVGSFSRLRPIERSQSANEKDQRWEERDRRFDRPFAGRNSGLIEDNLNMGKQDGSRIPAENWRRLEKDDENDWRSSGSRAADRFGNRGGGGGGSWRNYNERDGNGGEIGNKDKAQHNKDTKHNGPGKNPSNHPRQKSSTGHYWNDDLGGDNLPEWSMEEDTATDVGTFDSSGAFLETKNIENDSEKNDMFTSSEETKQSKSKESSPTSKAVPKSRDKTSKVKKSTTSKPPTVQNNSPSPPTAANVKNISPNTIPAPSPCETIEHINNKPVAISQEAFHVPQTQTISQKLHSSSVTPATIPTVSTVPSVASLLEMQKNVMNILPPTSLNDVVGSTEEDTFAHHKTATENMVAQWTQEDEQRVLSKPVDKSITVLPIHDKDAYKWFYRDPQGQIQGPFASNVMLDWLKGGFFTKELQIKRGCDERFVQLGDLSQLWNRIPFSPGTEPPPLRAAPISTDLSTPFSQSASLTNNTPLPVQYPQTEILQHQQLLQQLLYRQVQMQQTLNQMKHLDNFSNLPIQRQNLLLQQLTHQEQNIPRSGANAVGESPVIDQVPSVPFPLMGLNVPSLMKNDINLWGVNQNPGNWPSGRPTVNTSSSGSIWDTDGTIPAPSISAPIEVSELEKRMAAEEEEKHRLAMEAVKRLEEENKRKEDEELKRKQEEERLREIQKKKEEEQKRLEEIQRLKEQEQRRLDELLMEERRLEELKKQEELKREELRKQEEQRMLAEQRRLAELEEQRKAKEEEERRRQKEEEERKRREEQQKQDELRKKWEQEQEKLRETERLQKEAQKKKELEELEIRIKRETEKEKELQMKREFENKLAEQKGPVWGRQTADKPVTEMSLTDIQKLQAQKEKEEKERLKFQQQLQQHQQNLKQVQNSKNGLSWAKRANENIVSVKSLAEIQIEEAERMAQQQKVQKTAAMTVQATAASGVWGNSSHLNHASNTPVWNSRNDSFWDDALKSTTPTAQKHVKSNECAFPTLSNSVKPANPSSNKNRNVRAKKDEDAVLRLFETHRKPNDEFTTWCTEALSNMPSSVDVPTFVAFLKDVESPYEVYDYVRSYLGEGKEAKEFGKQFLERRSKYRNQTKQTIAEENMWGPAPAITPTVNKTSAQTPNDCDASNCPKSKTRKKKNRMQKVDNSMLGFTVQPNPDRINVGEIDRIE